MLQAETIDPGRAIVIAALILAAVWMTHPPSIVVYGDTILPPLPEPKA